jgi:hypothetical protein
MEFHGFDAIHHTHTAVRLDLSRYRISYRFFNHVLKNRNGLLIIDDPEGIFRWIKPERGTTKKIIPIVLKEISEDLYEVALGTKLYYSPTTREISIFKRLDFKETDKIYLPANQEVVKDFNFTLEFPNLGVGETKISFKTTFVYDNLLLGYCDDSEYCIISSLTNEVPPYFDYGD